MVSWIQRCSILLLAVIIVQAERDYIIKFVDMEMCIDNDDSAINILSGKVKKYNDTTYVNNAKGELKVDLPKGVQVEVVGYEKSGEEYGKSFLSLKPTDVCEMIQNDTCIYPSIVEKSNLPKGCPIDAGTYELKDYVLVVACLPDRIPGGEHWMFMATLTDENSKLLYCIKIYVQFEKTGSNPGGSYGRKRR